MKQDIRIGDDVRDVLANATIEGNILRLPPDLDRKLYQRVDQALSALGGAWNRKQRGHVFAGDPRTAIDAAADSGKVLIFGVTVGGKHYGVKGCDTDGLHFDTGAK